MFLPIRQGNNCALRVLPDESPPTNITYTNTKNSYLASSEAQQLNPLTFESFLPPKFCTIVEEIDDSSVEDEIHLENADGKETPKRRLHFSDAETSKHSTPAGDSDKGNRNNGKTFNFIPPMLKEGITVKIEEEEDICLQIKEGETTLIGYIIGDNPYELEMLEYFKKVWGFVELPRPMILRNWYMDFKLDSDMFSEIPIWVNFPRLAVGYWSVTALSKVSSAIGIPLVMDEFTAKAEKISYVRLLIEVDISKVLSDTIVVENPSGH
ncbi:hypothetical protein KY290_036549 [Solanum tuberosum]|uniref:DUF4283 domain-containing protein n=1 Tax=Solanum tuberosum TaxID=4113 RepID=A0ABQ7TSZ4_SOLTU|nr:hypothetical protein KY289_036040 [Solanum tuberosum]KAH0639278.1 hypothetical protein KY285_035864 [Solanum tuberosum]KAH0737844.1 hypothetical protein KY290_036549 [Solanum tuberosum]